MTDMFIPGQRWVSHADSTLGLGIVTTADSRRVTLHFPAVEEERVYATDRAPLTRLLLKTGDQLVRMDGASLIVVTVEQHAGIMVYAAEDEQGELFQVNEAELDAHIELNTPVERLLNSQLGKPADFGLRHTTLDHNASADGFGLRGLLGARTTLLSHQLYVAATVGSRFAPRVLLADEVGLGKTIEAGLIVCQQLLRQRAQRVLILTPETLTHQWLVEMQRRFHLSFSLLNAARLEDTDPSEEFSESPLVLSPINLFKSDPALQECARQVEWDMVVIDEAHHITGLNHPRSSLGEFIHALSQQTRGLLLLTATPEQAGLESHFERLQLIDPARFNDFQQFKKEQTRFSAWNHAIEQLEQGLPCELPADIDTNADSAAQIQQMLDRYGTGRVLYRNTRQGISGFPNRHHQCYPLAAPELYLNDATHLHPETLHPDAQWIEADPRVTWLQEQLKQLRPHKALVICADKGTAIGLEHHLHLKAGVRCAAFHEDLSLVERDRAAAYFAEESGGAQALICSEIGSEGRNFQFAKHLICFDLPRHPDLLEQRIGRLDRIGQGSDIYLHLPILENTAQAVVYRWLDEGLNAFNATCSVGHQLYSEFADVLAAAMQDSSGLDDLIETTRQRRQNLLQESEKGRDRLLERNSHDTEQGAAIIAALEQRESAEALHAFCEMLFDRIGIDQDYLDEQLTVIKPTENLVTGQLPGLDENGATATYDRSTALSRDDVIFLTWEHPIVMESMATLLSSDIGKASIGTFKHRGVPAGTVLLEALYRVECLAPKYLETGQFIDQTPLRMLLTAEGKEVGDRLSSSFLAEHLQNVPTATSAAALSKLRPTLESLFPILDAAAVKTVIDRREQAVANAQQTLNAEWDRLQYLQSVNPAVREEEVLAMAQHRDACCEALSQSQPVLEGLRVCIAL
jgi:ATP-dependent helicase HepA